MIYRLRKKFIRICMLSFAAVFILLFAGAYLFTQLQTNSALDTLTSIIAENGGRFPDFEEFGPGQAFSPRPEVVTRESPFTTRYFTVRFGSGGGIESVDVGSVASGTEEEAAEMARSALERGRERGWIGGFRYRLAGSSGGTVAVFVSGSGELAQTRRFLTSVLLVFLLGSLIVLLLVVLLSRRAVRPAVENLERQRQFITDANHELKTPLTLIRTNLDILESETGPSEWLDDIREETGMMTELVNRLVALSRSDEDAGAPPAESFSLSDAVTETAEAFTPAAEKGGLRLSMNIPGSVEYTGDEAAIRQLVSILMDNAVKYCDRGGEITVSLTGGRHPVITVDNTFAAVGTLELQRLFDRFYRSDRARTRGEGFGIGLSIARAITERHRGRIWAEAKDGGTFRIQARL